MKKLLLLFAFFISECIFSQDLNDIDKLTIDICNSMMKSEEKIDSIKVQKAISENLTVFIEKNKINTLHTELADKIFTRLQKNCDLFQVYVSKKYENEKNSDWRILDEKPVSKMYSKDCKEFLKKYSQFYLEVKKHL